MGVNSKNIYKIFVYRLGRAGTFQVRLAQRFPGSTSLRSYDWHLRERHTDRPKSRLSRDGVSGGISHYEAGFCYLIVIPTGAKRSGGSRITGRIWLCLEVSRLVLRRSSLNLRHSVETTGIREHHFSQPYPPALIAWLCGQPVSGVPTL